MRLESILSCAGCLWSPPLFLSPSLPLFLSPSLAHCLTHTLSPSPEEPQRGHRHQIFLLPHSSPSLFDLLSFITPNPPPCPFFILFLDLLNTARVTMTTRGVGRVSYYERNHNRSPSCRGLSPAAASVLEDRGVLLEGSSKHGAQRVRVT